MIFFFVCLFYTANYKVCMQYVAHCTPIYSHLKELPFLRMYRSSCTFVAAFKLCYTEKKME